MIDVPPWLARNTVDSRLIDVRRIGQPWWVYLGLPIQA